MGGLLCGDEGNDDSKAIRLLVLGISGSGKSTFTRQMLIIFSDLTDDERFIYKDILRGNVLDGMKEIANQSSLLDIDVEEKNRKHIRYFKENDHSDINLSDENIVSKIKSLWEDPGVQKIWEQCKNYQIQVSQLDYLVANLDRIAEPDYIPNDSDIVRGRQRTTGAYATRFKAHRARWEIIDVGGQLPERAKWYSIVQEGFTSIIYFAALDEYNMESSEDKEKTKMEVSINIFSEIVNDTKNFRCCHFLFLNKMDVFKEKILSKRGKNDFIKKFEDFPKFLKKGFQEILNEDEELNNVVNDDEEARLFYGAIKYIEQKFKSKIEDEERRKLINVFPTCAIEAEFMKTIFDTVKDHVFMERLTGSNIRV